MNKPNLLFVFSDQHRACDLGCYGNREVDSPVLDAFAAEGLRFTQYFSNNPLCVPARASLLTGLLPFKHRAIGNDLRIRTSVWSIADVLNSAGYRTGYIGKWHLAGVPRAQAIPPGRGRLGFTEWKVANCTHDYLHSYYDDNAGIRHPISGYESTTHTDLACDFIRNPDPKPWALYLSWGPPHDPYRDVPAQWLEKYDPRKLTLRPNVELPVVVNRNDEDQSLKEGDLRQSLQGYYAHISALDHEFGRLLTALAETGQAHNTIVIYTSDHGDMLGSHGWLDKQLPFEESVGIPLLVRWPEKIAPGVRSALLGLVDLPVTLLGAMSLKFPEPTDGKDYSSLFLDEKASGPDAVYLTEYTASHRAHDRGTPAWRAIRTMRHLFAKTSDGKPWLLFDLEKDPYQQHNRVGDPALSSEESALGRQLDSFVATYDAYCSPTELLISQGLRDDWNESQRFFGIPEI